MKWMVDFQAPFVNIKIKHSDKILFIGSCFTEHIGRSFSELKFPILQNPNGIIFDPETISSSIVSYIDKKQYAEEDLFLNNELWHSWAHHSRYSGPVKTEVLDTINTSQLMAHQFLKEASWLVITLGTAFQYKLADSGKSVANCHRVPAPVFRKHLMTIEEINISMDSFIHRLFEFNSSIKIIFTVSPVRHLRDGLIENNRSKARLLEVTHHVVNKFDRLFYFPAYELVIDVLRDYRFFDTDMAHPNYQATQFVLDHFINQFVDESAKPVITEMDKLRLAFGHKPSYRSTEAYRSFMKQHLQKSMEYSEKYPYSDFSREIRYFGGNEG